MDSNWQKDTKIWLTNQKEHLILKSYFLLFGN